MFKYIKSRFKALSPSDGLSSTISGLKQINRIIKRIIKMDKIYYAKAYDRNKNIQYFLSNTL